MKIKKKSKNITGIYGFVSCRVRLLLGDWETLA